MCKSVDGDNDGSMINDDNDDKHDPDNDEKAPMHSWAGTSQLFLRPNLKLLIFKYSIEILKWSSQKKVPEQICQKLQYKF